VVDLPSHPNRSKRRLHSSKPLSARPRNGAISRWIRERISRCQPSSDGTKRFSRRSNYSGCSNLSPGLETTRSSHTVASGCRRGEILALEIGDVNFETGAVHIKSSLEETKAGLRVKATKSEKPRDLTLPDWALPVLREHLTVISYEKQTLGPAYQQNGLLFPDREGSYQSPNKVGNRINYQLQKSGLRTTLHGLRHFHASWLLSNKTPLPAVSARLGHANPAITLAIYSHVMKRDDAALAATLDAGLGRIIPAAKSLRPVLVTPSATKALKLASEH
jgi:Phage integrase family